MRFDAIRLVMKDEMMNNDRNSLNKMQTTELFNKQLSTWERTINSLKKVQIENNILSNFTCFPSSADGENALCIKNSIKLCNSLLLNMKKFFKFSTFAYEKFHVD